jgi:hypothetical protein
MKKKKGKTMPCRHCSEDVHDVAEDAVAVTCWKCVIRNVNTVIDDDEVIEDDIDNSN